MKKVMIFLTNPTEKNFVQAFLKKLGLIVLSIDKEKNLADQILDSFPDLIIAASLGDDKHSLGMLSKLRGNKGVPKFILMRSASEFDKPLTSDQKLVIDSIIKSPIDPLKLIEALSETLSIPKNDLKEKYRTAYGSVEITGNESKSQQSLIVDEKRKNKYNDICSNIEAPSNVDIEKLSDKLKALKRKAKEVDNSDPLHDELKREFVEIIFKD